MAEDDSAGLLLASVIASASAFATWVAAHDQSSCAGGDGRSEGGVVGGESTV